MDQGSKQVKENLTTARKYEWISLNPEERLSNHNETIG